MFRPLEAIIRAGFGYAGEDRGPPMAPFYTVSHPNPSSSPGYTNLDLMMASRGRNMSSYN